MTNILDPKFRYYPSYDTDLRRTFARVRAAVAPRLPAPQRIIGKRPELAAPYATDEERMRHEPWIWWPQ